VLFPRTNIMQSGGCFFSKGRQGRAVPYVKGRQGRDVL
jgi:hypothetical protein